MLELGLNDWAYVPMCSKLHEANVTGGLRGQLCDRTKERKPYIPSMYLWQYSCV